MLSGRRINLSSSWHRGTGGGERGVDSGSQEESKKSLKPARGGKRVLGASRDLSGFPEGNEGCEHGEDVGGWAQHMVCGSVGSLRKVPGSGTRDGRRTWARGPTESEIEGKNKRACRCGKGDLDGVSGEPLGFGPGSG